MHSGLIGTIVGYRCVGDLDVAFSNGTTAYHKTYSHFKSGHMLSPGEKRKRSDKGKPRKKKMKGTSTPTSRLMTLETGLSTI